MPRYNVDDARVDLLTLVDSEGNNDGEAHLRVHGLLLQMNARERASQTMALEGQSSDFIDHMRHVLGKSIHTIQESASCGCAVTACTCGFLDSLEELNNLRDELLEVSKAREILPVRKRD